MTDWVSVYAGEDSNAVVSVSADFAEAAGLQVLKSDKATGPDGLPLPAREGNRTTAKTGAPSAPDTDAHTASKPKEA